MVCYYDPQGIPTIFENIGNWQRFSQYDIEILNLWPGRGGAAFRLPSTVDMAQYSGVIIHCAIAYSPANLFSLDQVLERPFQDFEGLKILMKQDEHVETAQFAAYIAEKKFDIVITCLPPSEREKVYPRQVVGDVDFIHAYTGYISTQLRGLTRRPMSERPIDISYRGSIQPLEFGRLGYEKRGIGYDVSAATAAMPDLTVDISSRWEDRINGTAWFDFLGRSKVVLGVESGSNLFDFTGEVADWCRGYEVRYPDADRYAYEFYRRAHDEYLHRFEGNVNYAQISPRHFEAAACGAAQILFEGEYSGIFVPHRHFFPLKRDLSNMAEAIDFARDDKRLKAFADSAFEEIVCNPAYHYENFVNEFDRVVAHRLLRTRSARGAREAVQGSKPALRTALMLMAHEPTLDPRVDWFSNGLAANFEVCEIGTDLKSGEWPAPTVEKLSERRTRVRVDAGLNHWNFIARDTLPDGSASLGLDAMKEIYLSAQLPLRPLADAIGALDATDDDLKRFRWFCQFFVTHNSALLEAGRRTGGFDLIVAVDFHTLPAAVALAEEFDVPLVYDAHEYWPFSLAEFRHWEVEFWAGLEQRLLQRVTLPITVSPQLANLMERDYGYPFRSLPNCVPLEQAGAFDLEGALVQQAQRDDVIFIVQGAFAPTRGFHKLIDVWDKVDPRAKLWLRGPDNDFKSALMAAAQDKGLLDRTVFFPDAVREDDLLQGAREADVGIVPYEPVTANNRFCSPNKLSQYLAAGLPVLCNDLDFVKSIVVGQDLGTCVNFNDGQALVAAIDAFVARRDQLPAMSRNAQAYFRSSLNWEKMSQPVYLEIGGLVTRPGTAVSSFDFDWIARAQNRDKPTETVSKAEKSAHEILIDEMQLHIEGMSENQQALQSEIDRTYRELTTEIERLNTVYPEEIKRLNTVYLDEIARLKASFPRKVFRRAVTMGKRLVGRGPRS